MPGSAGPRGAALRIAILDDYLGVAEQLADWSALRPAEVVTFRDHLSEPARLIDRLAPFDVVVAMRERTPLPKAVLERLPRLRLLVTAGMGNAVIDLTAAASAGITVCGTALPDGQTVELTWGLVHAAVRGIAIEDRAVRHGRWQTVVGRELAGSTLGVLGLGVIGSKVAHIAQAFGMRVVAWSEHLTTARAAGLGAERVDFSELFALSDVVCVLLRLSERTRELVRMPQLELLGPRGYLVNTARGPIVREKDLVDALNTGVIGGAALDVFDLEPLPPDSPLLRTPNTTLSPHNGFVTERALGVVYADAIEDIARWSAGDPVRVLAPAAGTGAAS